LPLTSLEDANVLVAYYLHVKDDPLLKLRVKKGSPVGPTLVFDDEHYEHERLCYPFADTWLNVIVHEEFKQTQFFAQTIVPLGWASFSVTIDDLFAQDANFRQWYSPEKEWKGDLKRFSDVGSHKKKMKTI